MFSIDLYFAPYFIYVGHSSSLFDHSSKRSPTSLPIERGWHNFGGLLNTVLQILPF